MPEAGAVDSWQLGDHLSVTYATDDECRDLLVAFVRRAVAAGQRVVVFLDAGAADLARALVAATEGVVMVDASDLRFVDAAGARTIVRFAAARPNRHTVVRCTRGVRQALRLCGADSVPSLVLRDQVTGV